MTPLGYTRDRVSDDKKQQKLAKKAASAIQAKNGINYQVLRAVDFGVIGEKRKFMVVLALALNPFLRWCQ